MKSNAIIRIIIYSVLILLTLSILAGIFLIRQYSFDGGQFSSVVTGRTVNIPGSTVKRLEIEWVSGTVTIAYGDTQDIAFSESSRNEKAEEMVWNQSGDTLTIQYSRPAFNIGIVGLNTITPPKDLTITVPRDWECRELEIESVSSDLRISEISCGKLSVENVSGYCELQNFSADKISLETVSGNACISGGFETLDVEAVSADCEVYCLGQPKKIGLDGVSGDLDLYLMESVGFTCSSDSLSEDFYSDFPTTISGDKHIYGDGSCIIEVDCVSGDVSIHKFDGTP